MEDINKLIEIAQFLKREDLVVDLHLIKERLEQPNKEIIIPIVGEFSSGKTSLINALTDSKKLETASKPTTATIFEIRFGSDIARAEIVGGGNQETSTENLEELKNDHLIDVNLVRVYDTSKKVPSSTVLVDTPGLSSNDPRHKLALTSYLPFSDAIFLAIDVNQQITRSLLEFVESTKLSQKPIYLIITKCDTKTKKEIEDVKKYIAENIKLALDHIVCVSAEKDDLTELFDLFKKIQISKNTIVTKALEDRTDRISLHLIEYINELLKNTSSKSSLDEQINEQNYQLEKIKSNIARLIKDARLRIEDKADDYIRIFSNQIMDRLDGIIKNQGADCDIEVYNAVNVAAAHTLENYKKDVRNTLLDMARERQSRIEAVPLQTLENLDLSSVAFDDFTYNMNLSELGHKNDKLIGNITKGVLIVGAAIATAGAASTMVAGAAGTGTIAVGTAQLANTTINMADTATDIASMASNAKTLSRMQKLAKGVEKAQKVQGYLNAGVNTIEQFDQQMSRKFVPNQNRGFIGNAVHWATDKAWGKPQRRRAISSYIDSTLLPEYKMKMSDICLGITRSIESLLQEEAEQATSSMTQALKEMEEVKKTEKEAYKKKVEELKGFVNILKSKSKC
ncbi:MULTISPECIES: dynamin family protein [Weeksellaceae]|uniref:Dynamin family protein n=1 Tax=Riemerella anatipestifer TaxID=34085 RepID=A0AAP6HCC9_RIEAN|nr:MULTISPECIES: dynamin family protein [Weeksellaceae]MBT0550166.1 dynamin family protein [Riemerella anatipestifer]MBT0554953.1 dynamin family protein [Riemerella anatipestifer]MBT0560916.1 dynamin family protein [Riemerella anatipestifer]MCO7355383.1 dynamin family protein [Riemerella anatipestifer]MCU7539435.1 dynamin family protein [Riemerella anatipestifer]